MIMDIFRGIGWSKLQAQKMVDQECWPNYGFKQSHYTRPKASRGMQVVDRRTN